MEHPLLSMDLHCHILPGIDDGAKSLADSEALARRLLEEGIDTVACTSHIQADLYPNTREGLLPLVASTQAHFDAEGIPMKLVPGAEVRLDLDSCRPEAWLTIGDAGRYMLVELPPGIPLVESLEAQLFNIQRAGITPIIAHPERQAVLQKDPAVLERWVDRGIIAQGTMCVLAGAAGERAIEALETFLRRGLIAVMGTDAHALDRRLRDMRRAADRLTELVGPENARIIRFHNPKAVLLGEPVLRPDATAMPEPQTMGGGLLDKLLAPFRRS